MKLWTVVGYYDDGTAYADIISAATYMDALIYTACAAENDNSANELTLLGAIEGAHILETPCDNGREASAVDLANLKLEVAE